jgi:serine/threonine-protein kinase
VRRYGVHRRILFGVAAWLLGAATATAGSLLAISLLGQGITADPGQLLTQDAVTRALATEAAEASPPPVTAPSSQLASPSASVTPAATVTPTPHTPDPAVPAAPVASEGTVLTSAGGEVVASCQPAGAYLISWSPRQGYEVNGVTRGPAVTARVTFSTVTVSPSASEVTMVVSCSAGVPSATSWVREAHDE